MKNMGLISVIVPIYNAEEHLSQCLDSIVKQTYSDLEVICINDGSTDCSRDILLKYALKDSRIKIVDKNNGGVSSARNLGLKNVHGEYVMFVDADDWIDLDTCEKAMFALRSNNADVVIWGYYSEHRNHSDLKLIFTEDKIFEEDSVRTYVHRRFAGLIGDELEHPEMVDSLSTVWGKLYRSFVLTKEKVVFIDLSVIGTCEDGLYNLEVFGNVKRVVYLAEGLYHYRRNNADTVTSVYKVYLAEQWKNLFKLMYNYVDSNNLSDIFHQALKNRIAISILGLTLNVCRAKNEKFLAKISLLQIVVNSEPYRQALLQLNTSYMPIHWKIFYGCAKHRYISLLTFLGMILHLMVKYR